MKMKPLEKLFIRSRLRVFLQRKLEAPEVLGNLGLSPNSTCLELGCGRGAGALLIRQYTGCRRLVGLDIDTELLRTAKNYIARPPRWARRIKTDDIALVAGDAARLSFRDGSFEGIFLFGVLDHIPEWREVITEVYRVLKAGGVFSFEDFLLASPGDRWGHVSIREAEMRKSLVAAGFGIRSFTRRRLLNRCLVRAVKPAI